MDQPGMIDEWYRNYITPEKEIMNNLNWLKATTRKLENASSDLATMYILTTNLWEILAGIFISRNMLVPANSEMARLAPKVLSKATFNDLILGEVATRKRIALSLCDQIIAAHKKSLYPTL